jgi:hypothetical protein
MSASLHFSNNNSDSYIRTDEELNMSNSNAMAVLSALGLDADFWDAPAKPIEELEQAISFYLNSEIASLVDGGTDTLIQSNPNSATMIFCGRREGYITEKVKIAEQCVKEAKGKGATKYYFA